MSEQVTITIDGRGCRPVGEKLLWAALRNEIYIPHLCAWPENRTSDRCRLCYVEIEGRERPVTLHARAGYRRYGGPYPQSPG